MRVCFAFAFAAALFIVPSDSARAQTSASDGPGMQIILPPRPAATTLTAAPASADFYVRQWTGALCASAPTGEEDSVGGEIKTCVVPPDAAVSVGVVFAPFDGNCENRNRVRASPTTCGNCLPTHALDESNNCRPLVNCDLENKILLNLHECGKCKDGFNDIATSGTCVANKICADEFRAQTNDATCGKCLPTHAEDDSQTCRPRINCDAENKVQASPYECGGCESGHNDIATPGTCVADADCPGLNRNQASKTTCGTCVADHNDLHDPGTTSVCAADADCAGMFRTRTDAATCGDCVADYSEADGNCKPHLNCAQLHRAATANLAVCGNCLNTHTDVGGTCVENENCAGQNREQTGATCGGCLSQHTEINGACLPNVDCNLRNRAQTNAAQCGDCFPTHAPLVTDADGTGVCQERVNCATRNRVQTNPYTCGDCADGFNNIALPQFCVENADCSLVFRAQMDDATCGDCLPTHAPDDSNNCRERTNCDAENKVNKTPFTCEGCKSGFNDLAVSGTCVANEVCADEFRTQTDDATCGECLPTHAEDDSKTCRPRVNCDPENKVQKNPYTCEGCKDDFNDIATPGTCVADADCPGLNRMRTNAATCGSCVADHNDLHDPGTTSACAMDADCAGMFRTRTDAATCGNCIADHSEVNGECMPNLNCAQLHRATTTNPAVCGNCLDTHTDTDGTCVENEDCAGQNREQTGATCGDCLSQHTEIDGSCLPNVDCSLQSRTQTNAAQCGDCLPTHHDADETAGYDCRLRLTCADDNKEQTNPYTCGDCKSGFNDIAVSGTCAENADCAPLFRTQTNDATCGNCLPTHADADDGPEYDCRPRVNCDAQNKVNETPFTCEDGCKDGFNDIAVSGTCVENADCASEFRVQTNAMTCGGCLPDYHDADESPTVYDCRAERITAEEVAADCAAAGGVFNGVDNNGVVHGDDTFTGSGTFILKLNPVRVDVSNPVNYCYRPNSDIAQSCYSIRPGFAVPQGADLRDGYADGIDHSKTCDSVHSACDSTAGKTERIAGNELSGCVDSE